MFSVLPGHPSLIITSKLHFVWRDTPFILTQSKLALCIFTSWDGCKSRHNVNLRTITMLNFQSCTSVGKKATPNLAHWFNQCMEWYHCSFCDAEGSICSFITDDYINIIMPYVSLRLFLYKNLVL